MYSLFRLYQTNFDFSFVMSVHMCAKTRKAILLKSKIATWYEHLLVLLPLRKEGKE